MVIDSILLYATAPGSGGAAASVASPGTLTTQPDQEPQLSFIVTLFQSTTGRLQIVTPSGHDTTNGFMLAGGQTTQEARAWSGPLPTVSRGETLSATIFGSSTAGDLEMAAISLVYPDASGAEFIDASELPRRVENVTTAWTSGLTPSVTGAWPTGTTLASLHSYLRPRGKYAVLGFETGSSANLLGAMLVGPDTGWYRQLWPVCSQSRGAITPSDYVRRLALEAPALKIPVITGGNDLQTLLGLVGNENATARNLAVHLALLK